METNKSFGEKNNAEKRIEFQMKSESKTTRNAKEKRGHDVPNEKSFPEQYDKMVKTKIRKKKKKKKKKKKNAETKRRIENKAMRK